MIKYLLSLLGLGVASFVQADNTPNSSYPQTDFSPKLVATTNTSSTSLTPNSSNADLSFSKATGMDKATVSSKASLNPAKIKLYRDYRNFGRGELGELVLSPTNPTQEGYGWYTYKPEWTSLYGYRYPFAFSDLNPGAKSSTSVNIGAEVNYSRFHLYKSESDWTPYVGYNLGYAYQNSHTNTKYDSYSTSSVNNLHAVYMGLYTGFKYKDKMSFGVHVGVDRVYNSGPDAWNSSSKLNHRY